MKTAQAPEGTAAVRPLAEGARPGRRSGAPRKTLRRALSDQARAYAFLLGGLICFALFSWYPAIRAVIISFQKYIPGSSPEWVGVRNFTQVFQDPEFAAAWCNTFLFTVLALLIGFL